MLRIVLIHLEMIFGGANGFSMRAIENFERCFFFLFLPYGNSRVEPAHEAIFTLSGPSPTYPFKAPYTFDCAIWAGLDLDQGIV